MSDLQGVWTQYGLDRMAAAQAGGDPIVITYAAIGTGNGAVPVVSPSQTGLVDEVWRGQVNNVQVNPEDSTDVIIEAVIPNSIGGFWIREWGLFDENNKLIVVGPHDEMHKPLIDSGQAAEFLEVFHLPVANTGMIQLSLVTQALATQQHVATKIGEHDKSSTAHQDIRVVLENKVSKTGDSMTGNLLLASNTDVYVGDNGGVQAQLNKRFVSNDTAVYNSYTSVLQWAGEQTVGASVFAVEGSKLIAATDAPKSGTETQYFLLNGIGNRKTVLAILYGGTPNKLYSRQIFNGAWRTGTWDNLDGMDKVDRAGDTMTGLLKFKIGERTSTVLDIRPSNANGDDVLITGGNNTVIGGGEFSQSYANIRGMVPDEEELVLGADQLVRLISGMQVPANLKEIIFDQGGSFRPAQNGALNLGSSVQKWAAVHANALYGMLDSLRSGLDYTDSTTPSSASVFAADLADNHPCWNRKVSVSGDNIVGAPQPAGPAWYEVETIGSNTRAFQRAVGCFSHLRTEHIRFKHDDTWSGWYAAATTEELTSHTSQVAGVHGAVSTATAGRIIQRDASGRAQVVSPAAANDIVNKAYVDSLPRILAQADLNIGSAGVVGRMILFSTGMKIAYIKSPFSRANTGAAYTYTLPWAFSHYTSSAGDSVAVSGGSLSFNGSTITFSFSSSSAALAWATIIVGV